MTCTLKIESGRVKLYVDGLVHVSFHAKIYIGLKSWIDENVMVPEMNQWGKRKVTMYYIKIFLSGEKPILLEWEQRSGWEQVLKELNKIESKIKINADKQRADIQAALYLLQ